MTQKTRTNRHRLLHTLVISSMLALDGCASGAAASPTPATAPATSSGGSAAQAAHTRSTEATASSTAAPAASSEAAPSPAASSSAASSPAASSWRRGSSTGGSASSPEALIASGDVRYCERGWPTTKGGHGSAPRCTTVVNDDGTTREECVDLDGPCMRRPE